MRSLANAALLTSLLSLFLLPTPASAGERKGHVEPDECSKKTAQCEKACDARGGMDRLSCKTDCRLAESQCRANKK